MAAADSTLDYIKTRYTGRTNSNNEEFDKWFNSPQIRWNEELTHLTRARGYIIHTAHIPVGATRCRGYGMDVILVTEEQSAELASNEEALEQEEPEIELYIPSATPPIETIDRWLIDEHLYMKYTNNFGRTRDNRSLIPILRHKYSTSYAGHTGGNSVDIISICTAYMMKIGDIIEICQQKWP